MSLLGAPIKVPRELLQVQQTVLEEYVRTRLLQFIRGFGQRMLQLAPELHPSLVDRAVRDVLHVLPQPDYGLVPVELLELQLVFRHDCLALGCNEAQCVLCQHNSQRRCSVNFCKKYLVNDRMAARCGAQIRVEVVDIATGKVFDGDLPDVFLELFILDGAQYDQRFLGEAGRAPLAAGGEQADAELEVCTLLLNNKSQPLLTSLTGCRADAVGRLMLQTQGGRVALPDVTVTDSSEALLSGRKPPFRLVARAKHADGRRLRMRHAVSEPFVVATRRVRASHKVEIPGMDDAVSKLDHMGRETVRKLADLAAAASHAGISLGLEPELMRVEKVGEFKALALRAEGDGHLRQQLQALLKLPKDKWEEAAEHAKRAVVPDNRMRAWYADPTSLELGLLFPCRLGLVDLQRPEALLQRSIGASGTSRVEVVLKACQSPMQRDVVRQLMPQAEASWWSPGHLGWTIFPADTDSFKASSHTAAAPVFDLSAFAAPAAAPGVSASALDVAALNVASGLTPAAGAAAAAAAGGVTAGADPAISGLGLQQPSSAAGLGLAGLMARAAVPAMPTIPAVHGLQPPPAAAPVAAPPQAAVAAVPGLGPMQQGLTRTHLSTLLQSAVAESAAAAVPATQQLGEQQATMLTGQQQHAGTQDLLQLPSADELRHMLQTRSLTEGVICAITAAYEANECPHDILNVLRTNVATEDPAAAAAAAAAAGAAAAGTAAQDDNAASSGGNGISGSSRATSPAASLKRTHSAAAFSHSTGGDFTGENNVAAPGCSSTHLSPGGGGAASASAGGRHCSSARAPPGAKRPASFSGAISTQRGVGVPGSLAAAYDVEGDISMQGAVQAAVAVRRPASFSGFRSRSLLRRVQEHPEGALAAAAAMAEGEAEAPHPFFQQLQRDSARSRSRGDLQAPGIVDGAAAKASAGQQAATSAAAAAAAAAMATAAAAAAAAAGKAPAAVAVGTAPGGVAGAAAPQAAAHPALPSAQVGPDGGLPADLAPGQSLDVPGLCAAYPSVLLDSLVASAAAAVASRDGATAAAAAAGAGTAGTGAAAGRSGSVPGSGSGSNSALRDSGCADIEVLLGDSQAQTQLALESLSSLGLQDCWLPAAAAAVAAAKQGAAAAGGAAASASGAGMREAGGSLLKPAMSAEMLERMSMELPSSLLQLNSSLLFGNSEKGSGLPPLPSILLSPKTSDQGAFGQADVPAMPKAMSLELPSSLLHFNSDLLQDTVAEKDARPGSSGAAAAAAAAAAGGGKEGSAAAGVGFLGWDSMATAGSSGVLAFMNCGGCAGNSNQRDGSGGTEGVEHVRRSGLDMSMDVGQALDEIMSSAELQQA